MDVTPAAYQRVRDDIDKVVHRGLDLHGLSRAATNTLGRVVPFDGTCLLTMDPATARVAVLIEAAQPPELAPLIADAYGLTDRERQVTQLVAQGFTTNQIAARLHLSAYTVQDHLKAIFDKTGTSSRGDLVARLFFRHYLPQLTTRTKEL